MADTQAKSLQLLEAYLSLNNVSKSNIADTFRNINKIRQGYPIHGDRSKGVLDAHKYFKITYPITDYSAAWKVLLNSYLKALQQLLEILKNLST